MAEVGIHFEDVVVAMFQRPFESGNVGRSKAQFALALNEVQLVFELSSHESLDNVGGAVGRTVVNDKYFKIVCFQSADGADDALNIFFFVVGRYDNDAITLFHI